MAVTAKAYGLMLKSALNKEIDYDTDTVKVMLCTSSYSPNQDTHQYKSDVTNEVSGTGYTAGGTTLANKTVTYDAASNTLKLSCDNPSWASATITAHYAVFYVDTGTASTSPLLCYWDFGADVSASAGTFTLTIPTSGILSLTAA